MRVAAPHPAYKFSGRGWHLWHMLQLQVFLALHLLQARQAALELKL
jgi:hypothetical protein